MKRRTFFRSGIAGAAGISMMGAPAIARSGTRENGEIVYRTLGRTGLKLPVVSFGVMRSDNNALVRAAYERGMKMFDTAHGYMNGRNEEMLGGFFSQVPRGSFVIATKVKPAGVDRNGLPSKETTAEDFLEKFNLSLTRLKLDYVDILYMHAADSVEMVRHPEIVNAMLDLKKKGRVRFIGISTHKNEPLVINTMADDGIWDVVLTSYNYRQTYLSEMNSALERAVAAGMGVVAMKTLAGGWLDRERTKPVNVQAALRWVIANPNVHTTIPGITAFDQLETDLKVMRDIDLTDEDKAGLIAESDCQGLYCNACSNCIPGCPNNLPIPELMRAYMYAYGYHDAAMASDLLREIGAKADPCAACSTCTTACVRGFDIRRKITDITRLVNVPYDLIA
ncbi:MAG: aldo/keto reductase [Bacteroidales bacterium]|jgi:predicted aldo/keto reductase-like oxidoreductase|nr:aldo/keto reductase [Bacteroidales bacterium]MCB9029337.1 aldo/keto reductase [Bacteroidales bacterium]MDD3736151.1 aldo/keto reductase [Bacteroidales bacterium]NLD62932.1 oxidoreductase [Bacteroidales bacterium]HNT92167.1 aldo/keto reductase [Bacteroidales bacterium]